MRSSFRLDATHDLIVSPWASPIKRQKLLIDIVGSLFAIIAGWWMITTQKGVYVFGGWIALIFFGLGLIVFLLQLRWRAILAINEQEVQVHTNPFLRPLTFSWSEIAAITLFEGKRHAYLGLALSPDALVLFLLRQPFLTRKLIERRMRRSQQVVLLSQRFLPNSLRLAYTNILQRYQPQLEQHHVLCESRHVF
jgi:hypothetical protein